jgi:hypothetical protein
MAASRRRFGSVAYRAAVIADSPAAYWRLGESSGTTAADETGSYNGTYVGSPTLGVSGPMAGNTAVTFDASNDVIDIPTLGISGATPRSWEFWINPDSTTGIRCILYSGANLSLQQFAVYFNVTVSDNIYLGFFGRDFYTGASTISRGAWSHVVAVYEGGAVSTTTVKIYINGVSRSLTAVGGASGSLNTASAVAAVGQDRFIAGRFFGGSLDEIACYNTALTAARILAHYNAAGY